MFRAYFDESGHETKDLVCVAGFVGHEDQWKVFDVKWRGALGPQRHFLHVNRLRFKQERIRNLLARLGPIPHECGLEAVRVVVRVTDYADLVAGTREEKLYSGYISCVPMLVRYALRAVPPTERLNAFFEESPYMSGVDAALPAFAVMNTGEFLTAEGVPKLREWKFVSKGTTNRTDPADYLAFVVREIMTNPGSLKAECCLPILGPQGTATPAYGLTIPRPQIRRMVQRAMYMNADWTPTAPL